MKAIFFAQHGDLSVLQYGDFPDPQVQPGWVILKVKACSLNYLDIFSRRGMPGIRVSLPSITGGDCVGEIVELGQGVKDVKDVTGWTVGQHVLVDPLYWDHDSGKFSMLGETCKGALAEYCTVHHSQLISLAGQYL